MKVFECAKCVSQICNLNGGNGDEETQCVEEFTASLTRYRWFFNLGQFLNGIGAAPLITLGTTLLDESVSKKNSPMYIGIFQVGYTSSYRYDSYWNVLV